MSSSRTCAWSPSLVGGLVTGRGAGGGVRLHDSHVDDIKQLDWNVEASRETFCPIGGGRHQPSLRGALGPSTLTFLLITRGHDREG